MKKNYLLTMSLLLGSALALNAQTNVMFQDFEQSQADDPTAPGWYEFINSQEGDEREVANGALHFYNSTAVEGANWQRAVKFRNLQLKENTSYRVSFYLSGDNTYNIDGENDVKSKARFALMEGQENGDIPFIAANDAQQVSDISYFQTPDEGMHKYTMMFYYANHAIQEAYYKEHPGKEAELAQKFFLTLNVFNPGDYYIDNVSIDESTIEGVTFYYDMVRVNFGYKTNAADILAAAGVDKLVYPEGTLTVTLNGEPVKLMSVELHKDGYLYAFCADVYPESADDEVVVSFKNPADEAYRLKYTADARPLWNVEGNDQSVLDFENEKGEEDQSINVVSVMYDLPKLVEADPENGSFNLPNDMKEFKFKFDKGVDMSKVKATLDGTELTPSATEGYLSEFTMTYGGGNISDGEHVLSITRIFPQYVLSEDEFGTYDITLSFGKVNLDPADTVKVVLDQKFSDYANNVPPKWIVRHEGEERTYNESGSYGSGCRVIGGLSGDYTAGIYICQRNASAAPDGGYAYYGAMEGDDNKFFLGAGKYLLEFNCTRWDADNSAVHVQVCTEAGDVIADCFTKVAPRVGSGGSTAGSTKVELNFRAEAAGNYVLKFFSRDENDKPAGWGDAILLGPVKVTYLPNAAGVAEVNAFNAALAEAKATLENNATERYAGTDYDALKAIIGQYEGQSFTSPSKYKAVTADIIAATDAMKNHRNLCDTYDPLVDQAKSARDFRTGTKFENHPCYAEIVAVIEKYEGKVLTDNAELEAAIAELKNSTQLVTNIGRVVETLTASMTTGLASLNKITEAPEEITTAVQNALSDDAAVKIRLKDELRKAIYENLSGAKTLFETKIDENTFENYVDSFDLSVFINNPEIYYTAWDDKAPVGQTQATPSTENVPGWTIDNVEKGYSFNFHYPWGSSSQYVYNAVTCPVANGMIASWGTGYDIYQELRGVPAGVYNIWFGAGERNGATAETIASYIYANTTEKADTLMLPTISGSMEPTDNVAIENVTVTDGKLKIGMHVSTTNCAFLNCVHLILKAAHPSFDYANGIEGVLDNAAGTVRTEYFDLNGRRVSANAKGLLIQKQTLSNGTVKARKVMK